MTDTEQNLKDPINSQQDDSQQIKKKHSNFFIRNFSPMGEGSLRLAAISMILCGTSGTYFLYPLIMRTYGIIYGIFVMQAIWVLNRLTSHYIEIASEDSKQTDYLNLLKHYLPNGYVQWAKFTFFMDYFATYVIGIVLAWSVG